MDSSVADAVAAILRPYVSQLHVRKDGELSLAIGGRALADGAFYQKLVEAGGADAEGEILDKYGRQATDFKSAKFGALLKKAMKDLCQAETPSVDFSTAHFNDSISCSMSDLKLVLNLNNRKRSALYDPKSDQSYIWDFDFVMDSLRAKFGDKAKASWLRSNSEECKFVFMPFKPRFFKEKKGNKVFNLWFAADWHLKYEEVNYGDEGHELPSEVKKFIEAFSPVEEDRRCILAWMRDCTFGRANPILILCGTPGVGKNNFIMMCRALVGMQNYKEATRGFKDTQFHNTITNSRLFFLDEMDLTPKTRDILKAYHNGQATVERKFEHVGDPEPVHASFCIANNFKENIKLEYTDRKFFAPVLSTTSLEEKMTKEEIDNLMKVCLEDDEYLQRIARHLQSTYKPNESERFKKGPFFKELCINSYPYFFKRFINACKEMESFTQKTLNAATKHRVEPGEIVKHLEHYETTFRKPLAAFELHVNGTWTATSKIYKPKSLANGKDHSPMVDELSALSEVRMPQ